MNVATESYNFICPPIDSIMTWKRQVAGHLEPEYHTCKIIGSSPHRIRIEVTLDGKCVNRSVCPENLSEVK